jgi:hypothetical protein
MKKDSEEPPPDSRDLDGWRQAIADGLLGSFRPEALVCAVQDLGPKADPRVLNPIAKRLSAILMKMARKLVGTNKPNRGEDIILRVSPKPCSTYAPKRSPSGSEWQSWSSSRRSPGRLPALFLRLRCFHTRVRPDSAGIKSCGQLAAVSTDCTSARNGCRATRARLRSSPDFSQC